MTYARLFFVVYEQSFVDSSRLSVAGGAETTLQLVRSDTYRARYCTVQYCTLQKEADSRTLKSVAILDKNESESQKFGDIEKHPEINGPKLGQHCEMG